MEKKSSKQKRAIQKKAFTTWSNSILKQKKSSSVVEDLFKSLRDGQVLGELLESITGERPRGLKPAKTRQRSVNNVEFCLDFLEDECVSTRGIDSEDIVDGCPDTTLELMWAIMTGLYINRKEMLKRFGSKTVEEALLLWAQDKTKGYRGVQVKDFTSTSWKDGLAFLALINAHRPSLLHFDEFHSDERRYNLKTAFDEAKDELGIPCLLDVDDLMKSPVDERSVAAYVACFYKQFADKRGRSSSRRSRSGDSDTSSASETSCSDDQKKINRNKQKQKDNASSRTSSTSSNSSDKSKRRRGLKKKNERGRTRSSSTSSSSEGRTTKRGSSDKRDKVRSKSSSSTGSSPDIHKNRKGLRNRREEVRRSSISSEKRKGIGKRRTSSRDRNLSPDRIGLRARDRRYRRSNSRDRKHSSDRSVSRARDPRYRRSNSRDRNQSPDRIGLRARARRYRRSNSRDRKHSSDRSVSRTRHGGHRRGRSYSNSPDRRGDRGRHERPLASGRNSDTYKGDFHHLRERRRSYSRGRNRSSSNSDHDNEYPRTNDAQFYTLNKKQRNKFLNAHSPTIPDDWFQNRKEIFRNSKRYPGPDQCQDVDSALLSELFGRFGKSKTAPQRVPFNPSPVQFEWQFQDEHGAWITYGKPNSAGNAKGTTTTSDDIENYFVANPGSPPVLAQAKKNCYILNFVNMIQTNQKTNVQRPIRRMPKQFANITPINVQLLPQAVPTNPAAVGFEWQFQDEHGSWITYGKPNSTGNMSHVTTTSSDDIERHYASNSTSPASLTINSNNNASYVLDFSGMTQTNQQTSVQRPIRRIPKLTPGIRPINPSRGFKVGGLLNPNILHEWQFEDENGSWIAYGKANSTGNVSHITTSSSDDIEKHYASNPANASPLTISSKNNAQYVLDFKSMTQTNQQTSVQRRIRRVVKSSPSNTAPGPDGGSYVWSFQDDLGNWVKYGNASSSNDATSATTTTSDEIEAKYARNHAAILEIASGQHKYLIDLKAMNQTNMSTGVVRNIQRKLVKPSDLPSTWAAMNASNKGLLVVALNKTDSEYTNQEAFIKKTLPKNLTITKMFRIQNENLWTDYVYKKNSLQKRYPNVTFKEEYLFHGTDSKHLKAICEENFDFRLNGTNATVYGKGSYFARSSAYSANYSRGSPRVMFIVKVLVGKYTVGNTNMVRPPKDSSGGNYDTTVDNTSSPTIFVKYDNTEYYPDYYFEFT